MGPITMGGDLVQYIIVMIFKVRSVAIKLLEDNYKIQSHFSLVCVCQETTCKGLFLFNKTHYFTDANLKKLKSGRSPICIGNRMRPSKIKD